MSIRDQSSRQKNPNVWVR